MTAPRVVVVGAGIVGLAVARAVRAASPAAHVTVVEKEDGVARHQTGHNTGVIHAGALYPPGSAKTELCVRGAALMKDYCRVHGVPMRELGKLFIAADADEAVRLRALYERGRDAGVEGLEYLGASGIADYEPHAVGHSAVLSSRSAVVDYAVVAESVADGLREAGVDLRLAHTVTGFEHGSDVTRVVTDRGSIDADVVIVCAGLYSDRLARLDDQPRDPRIFPFRGEYFELREHRRHLVRTLIYPVPNPRYPFLGVHLTRHVDDRVTVGPTAFAAFARQGYRRTDVEPRQLWEFVSAPGFRRFARQHWRAGAEELRALASRRVFLSRARKYVPELTSRDLVPHEAGVRAQALDADGSMVDDFRIVRSGRVVHVRNARSPAATAAFAIAERVMGMMPEFHQRPSH